MKNEIYISGGEVKVVTLLDKLAPDFWMTGDMTPAVSVKPPMGIEATLSRLVAEVREELNARAPKVEIPAFDADAVMQGYLSRGQRAQAVNFTNVAVTWIGELRRIGQAVGKFMQLMLATPVY